MECNTNNVPGALFKKVHFITHIYMTFIVHIYTTHVCILIFLDFFIFHFLPDLILHPYIQRRRALYVLMKCAVLCFAHLNYHLISLSFMICCVRCVQGKCRYAWRVLKKLCSSRKKCKSVYGSGDSMCIDRAVVCRCVVLINEMLKNVHVLFFSWGTGFEFYRCVYKG